jgi:glutaredoxin
MNPVAAKILRTYDEVGRDSVDLHTLFELAGGNPPAEREAVLDAVSELAASGLLHADSGDFYSRTEQGRVAVAPPLSVTVYTRPGCQLCEEAKSVMEPLLGEFGATLREVNIDADTALRELYTNDVPVVLLGSRKVAKHRVDAKQFRRQLADAKR